MSLNITKEQLIKIIGPNVNAGHWVEAMNNILPDYNIDTPERVAAFIAQCAHESASFTRVEENLNYRWQTLRKVFRKYFPTDEYAKEVVNSPNKEEIIANTVYANRMGNGPFESGDGYRNRGRGLIQLTGLENYSFFAKSLDIPLEDVYDYAETFEGAIQSACWFWENNNLNRVADEQDLDEMTRIINGGYNGLEERRKLYNKALRVFGVN